MEPVNICIKAVQGKEVLVSEEKALFVKLITSIKDTFNIKSTMDGTGGVDILLDAALGSMLYSKHDFYGTHDGLQDFF